MGAPWYIIITPVFVFILALIGWGIIQLFFSAGEKAGAWRDSDSRLLRFLSWIVRIVYMVLDFLSLT